MSPQNCRFAISLGLSTVAYIKVERLGESWQAVAAGEVPWGGISDTESLHSILTQLVAEHELSRDHCHITLDSRFCVTRIATGNESQINQQFEEIERNSQHYLQMGLGDQLRGKLSVPIDEVNHYGQVAIVKRGLIESLEEAAYASGLEIESVDGAMPSACRLAGYAGLDTESPILLVRIGESNAEIAISFQGKLQLSYHLGNCRTASDVAKTLQTHMKRLVRFCGRYRAVKNAADLEKVVVLAGPSETSEFNECLDDGAFEELVTLDDLASEKLGEKLGSVQLATPGVVGALGGLLPHLEDDALPSTDVYDKYLASKPKPLLRTFFAQCWLPLSAAAGLMLTLMVGWLLESQVESINSEIELTQASLGSEREQLLELDEFRCQLREGCRLQEQLQSDDTNELVRTVAGCLTEDARIDFMSIETGEKLVLRGTMLSGDRTYDLLQALRNTPLIDEVALESVGASKDFDKNATLFEIHCQLAGEPVGSLPLDANDRTSGRRAQ